MTNRLPIVPHHSLLPELLSLVDSGALGDLWADESFWQSLNIDYHPPRVERLYTNLGKSRGLRLQRIHPCEPNKTLWHTYPNPIAVLVLAGKCEHSTGFVDRHGLHCNSRSILGAGASYEIVDPLAWCAVRPIDGPVYSVMLTGQPWTAGKQQPSAKSAPQRPLTPDEIEDLRRCFGDLLVWNQPTTVADFAKHASFETDVVQAAALIEREVAERDAFKSRVDTTAYDQHMANGGNPRTAPGFVLISTLRAPARDYSAVVENEVLAVLDDMSNAEAKFPPPRCGAVGEEACVYFDRSANECSECTPSEETVP